MITVNVLAFGEAYVAVFKVIAAFCKGGVFASLIKVGALVGITAATMAYVKGRDPMVYAKWIALFTLITSLALAPQSTVQINEISTNNSVQVANVPHVVAFVAGAVTNIGYGLASEYDKLLAQPDSVSYSKTGMLFGSKLMLASHAFHIIDKNLKLDVDMYFRNCVVGDININKKYSMSQILNSKNILSLTTKDASPVRMTTLKAREKDKKDRIVSCKLAATEEVTGIKARLNQELSAAYDYYGHQLFNKPGKDKDKNQYKELFDVQLTEVSKYYSNITETSENLFLQSMMVNALQSGLNSYSINSGSSAAILNNQFAKTQMQHRTAWNLGFEKAVWFLPLMHTILMLLCLAVFPIVMLFSLSPGGFKAFKGLVTFLISLQLWPVLFAILNAIVNLYGQHKLSQIGAITSASLDPLEQAHHDLAGVAGFLMMSIPFLAKGFVSNIGEAFSGLATSMTGHMQSSSMAAASEAANASFSLGNTSVHNTNANNLSANKHDSNFTQLKGQAMVQTDSGAMITKTSAGDHVINASGAISNGVMNLASTESLQDSLSQLKEKADASVTSDATSLNSALAHAARSAMQYNETHGLDTRLGLVKSITAGSQESQALGRIQQLAHDAGQRLGLTDEEALSGILKTGVSGGFHFNTNKLPLVGGLMNKAGVNFKAGVDGGYERNSSTTERGSSSSDWGFSQREEESLRKDISTIKNYNATHHLDSSHTNGENLLSQISSDLTNADTLTTSLSASLSKSQRIADTQSFVATNSQSMSQNLNQEALSWAAKTYGQKKIDELAANTSDPEKIAELAAIESTFMRHKAESLINIHQLEGVSPSADYSNQSSSISHTATTLRQNHQRSSESMEAQSQSHGLGVSEQSRQQLNKEFSGHTDGVKSAIKDRGGYIQSKTRKTLAQKPTRVAKKPVRKK